MSRPTTTAMATTRPAFPLKETPSGIAASAGHILYRECDATPRSASRRPLRPSDKQFPSGSRPELAMLLLAKLLAESQFLALIRGAYIGTVNLVRPRQQAHVFKSANDLPMLDHERNLVGAYFQHGPGPLDVARAIAKTGIKEAGIVNAKFPYRRIDGDHLRRILGGHAHPF